MSFLGAFGFTPTSLVLPSILLVVGSAKGVVNAGEPLSAWYKCANVAIAAIFAATTVMAGVTSLRDIIANVAGETRMFT